MVKLALQIGAMLNFRRWFGAPVNQVAPQVTGTATTGQTLSTSNGTWSNSPTGYSYQWLRNGSAISGATGKTYTATQSDVAASLSCRVTATNKAGSNAATSNKSAQVAARAPTPVIAPTTANTARVGDTMTASSGEWDGDPDLSYAYQWMESADGQAWAPISGAASASMVVAGAQYGKLLRAVVTATNLAGSAQMATNATSSVSGTAPQVPTPTISGGLLVGNLLTANIGLVTGYPPPTTVIQWLANGTPITGANALSMTLGLALLGKSLSVRVTATNAEGSTTVTSASTGLIANLL